MGKARKRNFEDLPFNFTQFENACVKLRDVAINAIGKQAHITEDELRGAAAKVDAGIKAMKESVDAELNGDKTKTPATTEASLSNKYKELDREVRSVVNKKPPPPPPKEEKRKSLRRKKKPPMVMRLKRRKKVKRRKKMVLRFKLIWTRRNRKKKKDITSRI